MLEEMRVNEFDSVYRIMEQSFPTDEYRPYDEQRRLLDDPRYTVYVHHADWDGDVDAFLAVWQFEAFAFLEHFAVAPTVRNCGLGTKLLKALSSVLGCCICLEVEFPDTPIAAGRIAFYQRAGFVYHDFPYLQPAISKGRQPVPLRLMTQNANGIACTPQSIKTLLYREVYRVVDGDSVAINKIQEDEI